MDTQPMNPIIQFFQSSDVKFYLGFAGVLWSGFKGYNWVRDFREKDVKGLKEDLSTQTTVIKDGFAGLSQSIHDMRTDLRTFYTSPDPLMMPVSARGTRKRKSVAGRAAAKKKAPAKKNAKA